MAGEDAREPRDAPEQRILLIRTTFIHRPRGTDVIRKLRGIVLAGSVAVLAATGIAVTAHVASAATTLCGQYASVHGDAAD
jgi:hypothetical protein